LHVIKELVSIKIFVGRGGGGIGVPVEPPFSAPRICPSTSVEGYPATCLGCRLGRGEGRGAERGEERERSERAKILQSVSPAHIARWQSWAGLTVIP